MSVDSGQLDSFDSINESSHGAVTFLGGAYRANLYVFDPMGSIHWFVLKPDSFADGRLFTIGRAATSNIVLSDGSVSNRHAYITCESGELILRDLGSTNGTEVNEEAIREVALRHGDAVKIGVTYLRFLFSFRATPVRLALAFDTGQNRGKVITTYTPSLTIGRADCAVCLNGADVAQQHVRVDAFGPELIFVVNLHEHNRTQINGRPVVGIEAARNGDRLTVGEHELTLQVVDDPDLIDAVPTGDGTLQVEGLTSDHVEDRVGEMSAVRSGQLNARRLNHNPAEPQSAAWLDPAWVDDEDNTLSDLPDSGEAFHSPRGPRDRSTSDRMPAQSPLDLPAPLNEMEASGRRKVLAKPSASVRRMKRIRARVLWFLPPAALLLTVLALHLTPVTDEVELTGIVAAGHKTELLSPTRAQVEAVYVAIGDQVKAGAPIADLLDLEVQARIKEVTKRATALERKASKAPPAPRRRPGRYAVALGKVKTLLRRAQEATSERLAAFNRREIPLAELDAARQRESKLRGELAQLEARARQAESVTTDTNNHGQQGQWVKELATQIGRRESLEKRLRLSVKAPNAGVILAPTNAAAPRPSAVVPAGQVLFVLANVATARAKLTVPGALLGVVERADGVTLVPEGFPDRSLHVKLGAPAPVAAPDGTFPVEAVFPNAEGLVRPGQRVTVTLPGERTTALKWLWSRLVGKN